MTTCLAAWWRICTNIYVASTRLFFPKTVYFRDYVLWNFCVFLKIEFKLNGESLIPRKKLITNHWITQFNCKMFRPAWNGSRPNLNKVRIKLFISELFDHTTYIFWLLAKVPRGVNCRTSVESKTCLWSLINYLLFVLSLRCYVV